MNVDDPKLTAYALGELEGEEEARVEAEVASSPEAERIVDETRELAQALKAEFAAEVMDEVATSRNDGFLAVDQINRSGSWRRDRGSLADIRDDRWFWQIARPLSIAAILAVT